MNTSAKYLILIICLIIAAAAIFVFLSRATPAPKFGKLQVVTSFYPLYFFSNEIAGDRADITNITPAGTEPHEYEPTAQEIVRIQQSDLLILNGGNLEAWVDKIKNEISGNSRPKVVAAGENLINKQITENGKTAKDPHIWLNPLLAEGEAGKILEGFIEADPANASYYQVNARSLQNKLAELDQKFAAGLDSCTRKDFITSHAAFGYLADRYHLRQVAIAGISPDEEPSTARLTEIAKIVEQKGIKYIFVEKLASPKLAQTIATETGAKTLVLDPIEGLTDFDIKAGKNYFTQMEMNLRNLKLALECKI